MYSFPNLESVHCSMSSSNCCLLTYIQVSQEACKVVWYSFPSLEKFCTVCGDPHSQKFGIVNNAEIDVFLELSSFFNDPVDVGNLISGSSAFSKWNLNIWKFSVCVLLKPSLENFKHYFASEWDQCDMKLLSNSRILSSLWKETPYPLTVFPLLHRVCSH